MTLSAVILDTREAPWVKALTFNGLPVTVSFLEVGDALCACDDGNLLCIERKSPDDFLGSLKDDRLFLQLANMKAEYRFSYLMITDSFGRGANNQVVTERGQTGWSWNALQGTLITIQEIGVLVTYSAGDTDYENAIIRLANRNRSSVLELGPAKLPRILSINETIICSLPGIGLERLHSVMDYCGTAAWAICALTDDGTKIPNVPMSVKKRVRQALGLKPEEQLGVLVNDLDQEVLVTMPFGSQ